MRTSNPNEGSTRKSAITPRCRRGAGALTSHEGKPREEPGSGKLRFMPREAHLDGLLGTGRRSPHDRARRRASRLSSKRGRTNREETCATAFPDQSDAKRPVQVARREVSRAAERK
jgi:hypothetical protein